MAAARGSHDGYTRGELVYLLALSHDAALEGSVAWRSSLAGLSNDGPSAPTTSIEPDPVFLYSRWSEVRRARERVVHGFERREVFERRLSGESEREIAEALEISQSTVHRSFRRTLEAIAELLGGFAVEEERFSIAPPCIVCQQRPRARIAAIGHRQYGVGWVEDRPERSSSCCRECTIPSRRHLLVPEEEPATDPATSVNQTGDRASDCV